MKQGSKLNDNKSPILVDFETSKNTLLIAFTGLGHKLGIPIFEFCKLTSKLDNINKIFIRDQQKAWFHRGLPGVGDNINCIVNHLENFTMHPSTKKVVLIGNSGGGYAALLFGELLQADEVYAFVPVTKINPLSRLLSANYPRMVTKRHLLSLLIYGQRRYFDLNKHLKSSSNRKTKYHIYYSASNKNDCFHANRMKNISNIYLHPYQYEKHDLVQMLKQSGELKTIIERSIT